MTSISTRSSATLALEGVLSDLLVDLIFKSRFRSFFFTLWFNFKSYVLTSAGRRGGGFTARSPPGLPVVQTAQGDPGSRGRSPCHLRALQGVRRVAQTRCGGRLGTRMCQSWPGLRGGQPRAGGHAAQRIPGPPCGQSALRIVLVAGDAVAGTCLRQTGCHPAGQRVAAGRAVPTWAASSSRTLRKVVCLNGEVL